MSTHPNRRRGEKRRTDNGSRHEGDPNDGGKRVRIGRRAWKRMGSRKERRTGSRGVGNYKRGLGGRKKSQETHSDLVEAKKEVGRGLDP